MLRNLRGGMRKSDSRVVKHFCTRQPRTRPKASPPKPPQRSEAQTPKPIEAQKGPKSIICLEPRGWACLRCSGSGRSCDGRAWKLLFEAKLFGICWASEKDSLAPVAIGFGEPSDLKRSRVRGRTAKTSLLVIPTTDHYAILLKFGWLK